MKKLLRPALRFILPLAIFPTLALAHPGHPGHDLTWDFNTGFSHPWTGLDHFLAMIAVGLWAAQLGGKARWYLPATFLGIMSLGAVLGSAAMPVPGLEQGIAASVFVLGILVATSARLPLALGMGLTALFALFHGYAHGAGIPATSSGLSYGLGFLCATAVLQLVGLGLGSLAQKTAPRAATFAGCAIAAAGILLLAV